MFLASDMLLFFVVFVVQDTKSVMLSIHVNVISWKMKDMITPLLFF